MEALEHSCFFRRSLFCSEFCKLTELKLGVILLCLPYPYSARQSHSSPMKIYQASWQCLKITYLYKPDFIYTLEALLMSLRNILKQVEKGLKLMNEFICQQTRSPWYKLTFSAQRRLIKTDKTERFATTLEAESQGYRHFLNRTFCNGVGGKTTALQPHSSHLVQHCCRVRR